MRPDTPAQTAAGRVTLRDLARALGVSVATVSNAYNRPDQLSAELRERVLDTARLLGYGGPDPLARSLRRGRTGVIGVVYDAPLEYAFADPAATLFLGSLAQTLQAASLNLLLLASPDGSQADPLAPVQSAGVDGLIVYSAARDSELLQTVLARGLPTVLVDQDHHPQASAVRIDDAGGARLAAQHLLELGHREIGVLCLKLGPQRGGGRVSPQRAALAAYRPTTQRLRAYREAAAAAGATLYLSEAGRNTLADAQAHTLELLRAEPQITALLCMSDVLAQGALRAAQRLGWAVPQRLSVVGYDDLPGSADLKLTTVWQPTAEKGRRAGQAMLGLLGGQPQPDADLPIHLVVRGSTAPQRERDDLAPNPTRDAARRG